MIRQPTPGFDRGSGDEADKIGDSKGLNWQTFFKTYRDYPSRRAELAVEKGNVALAQRWLKWTECGSLA